MDVQLEKAKAQANFLRYKQGVPKGHYESYFLRANHPTAAQAFWIRYTVFSPKNDPLNAIGELWAVYFDGEEHHATKKEFPIEECYIQNTHFEFSVGDNQLNSNKAIGKTNDIEWDLEYRGEQAPLFLMPINFYDMPFPKAKALVPLPFAKFSGLLKVKGKEIDITDWIGSQNHNWGEKHTDYYAWGQVAGFDNSPDTFLEVGTGKLKIGPVMTPYLTLLVLRYKGKEYKINAAHQWFLSKGKFGYFDWTFECENKEIKIKGKICANKSAFVGLRYYNPPGGDKSCLNSKIASCHLTIEEKNNSGEKTELFTKNRAAFEILTDDSNHGLKINF